MKSLGGEEKGEYGNQLIKEYSKRLTKEIGKGYSVRSLYNMRAYYIKFNQGSILHALRAKLYWNHYKELLTIKDLNKISYYIKISMEQNLSYRQLHERIKNKEYERLGDEAKYKLITQEQIKINDFIKNPIILKNTYNLEKITEKYLKQLILEQLNTFLLELGEGFCYISDEYKIKIGDRYNYIDLLLFNIKYNCYVVAELKVTELKKEHIGQIQTYMNYIDKHVKRVEQEKTIGIIVSAKDNKIILEYCSDPRIYETKFILS